MKNLEEKYGALLLRSINQEHVVVRAFDLEYNDDTNLSDLRDLLVSSKYKSFEQLSDITEHASCYSWPNPFWDKKENTHLIDLIGRTIFDVAWSKDFSELEEDGRVEAYLQIKKDCDKIVKKIERIAKKIEKDAENEKNQAV